MCFVKLQSAILIGLFLVISSNVAMAQTSPTSKITRVAGGGTGNDGVDAKDARLIEPFGVGFDGKGNLFIVEMEGGDRVRKVDRKGHITTIGGTGTKGFSGDDGPSNYAQLNGPHHLLVIPNGDIFIADTFNNRVRFIDHTNGRISTIVGTGERGFSGDSGPAEKAQFNGIICLALSENGDRLYVCDINNHRIRMINRKTGLVSTVAGNGQRGNPEDGQNATDAPLVDPRAIAVDNKGNLFILERGGNALRMVDLDGKISTLIGSPGHELPTELGKLNGPKHLCTDGKGGVYIADTENHRILRYNVKNRKTIRVAGSGIAGDPKNDPDVDLGGSPLEIRLLRPHGVFVRPDGTLFIADSGNDRILSFRP